jgi:hypothetical protein
MVTARMAGEGGAGRFCKSALLPETISDLGGPYRMAYVRSADCRLSRPDESPELGLSLVPARQVVIQNGCSLPPFVLRRLVTVVVRDGCRQG